MQKKKILPRLRVPLFVQAQVGINCLMGLFNSACIIVAMRFTEEQLLKASNGFSQQLGNGGFGLVYKGYMNGSFVALKKLTEVSTKNTS